MTTEQAHADPVLVHRALQIAVGLDAGRVSPADLVRFEAMLAIEWTDWPRGWSDGAAAILRKYRRPLAEAGIDVDEWRQIADHRPRRGDGSDEQGYVALEPEGVVLHARYQPDLIAAIKRLPARKYRHGDKAWVFPMACRTGVIRIAEEYGLHVSVDVLNPDRKVAHRPPTSTSTTVVDCSSSTIEIEPGDASPGEQDAIRFIRGSRFDAARGRWQLPLHLARVVRELAAANGWTTTPAFDALPDVDPTVQPVTLRSDGGLLLVSFPYDKQLVAVIQSIAGARWDKRRLAWTLPAEQGMSLLELLERQKALSLTDHAGELLDQARRMVANVHASRALDADLHVDGLAIELRPFQRAAVAYSEQADGRCLLADPPGAGKTPMSLAILQHRHAWPACVVVPAVVKENWAREIVKWCPHLRVATLYGVPSPSLARRVAEYLRTGQTVSEFGYRVLPGRPIKIELRTEADIPSVMRLIRQVDIVIVNYDLLGPTVRTDEEAKLNKPLEPGWTPIMNVLPWAALICDESHMVKNRAARRTRACLEVSKSLPVDATRLCASASMIENRRGEIAAQLEIIGRLGEFGGYDAVASMPDLAKRLRARCMVRREQKDYLPELPPIEHVPVILGADQLDKTVMVEYRKAERDLLEWLAERARRIAIELGEDPQSAAVAARMRAAGSQYLIRINVLRQLAMRAKIAPAERWTADFKTSGSKLLVFAHHLEPLRHLAAKFDALMIEGKVSSSKRLGLVDRFEDPNGAQIACLQMEAGGVGLTMTAAHHGMFVEQAWSPLKHDQACGRGYGRLSNLHGFTAYYLLAENTIDEWISELLAKKRVEITDALDGDITDDDIEETSVYSGLVDTLTARALAA